MAVYLATQNIQNRSEWFKLFATDVQTLFLQSVVNPLKFLIMNGNRIGSCEDIIEPRMYGPSNAISEDP
jgi:hypothetical protein